MKAEMKIKFLLATLISFIFLFKLPTAFTQEIDPISQFNQTSSVNITGNASTLDQQQINSYLNFNADGLTWDITENEIPIIEQKTVEYFIYQDMTQMAANTEKSASFTIYLPEKNPKIKSAIVEIKNNIYNTQITADQTVKIGNGTTNTTLLTTAAGPSATGENMPYVILVDATSAFDYINQNGTYTFTLYVKFNAIRQGENAKLILTYEYDSDSPRQIKTVRFFIGQLTGTLAVGSSTAFTVPALNLPESGVVVRDSFFETYIHLQPGGTTDEGISINLDGSNAVSGTPIDNAGATTTTHIFLYKNIFDTTTSHTFNFLPTAGYAIHGVGTELVLTYEYDVSSPIQLKTLRYLIGQDGGLYTANHTATFQKQVPLPENNKAIRNVYNRVTFAIAYGSGAGTTAYTTYIGINSSLQGYQQPQVTYALGLRDEQVSTTTLLYNASGLYNLEDGSTVICSVFSSAVSTSYYTGSKGCELVVTYTYDAKSSTRAKTVEYFVGQSYNSSLANSASFSFQLQIPEQAYSIKNVYLNNFGFTGSATAGTNTLVSYINVPGYVSQTCNFRNTGEARFDMCRDDVSDNVTVAKSYTAVLSSGVTRWFSSKITTTYTYNAYYQVEVEHNTTASYSGSLKEIDVMINFSSTADDVYGMKIYDFVGSKWDDAPCQSQSVTANEYYTLWCNVTTNPTNYNSSKGTVRVMLSSTSDIDQGTLKEEYIQFYIVYSVGYLEVELLQPSTEAPNSVIQTSTFLVNATVFCRSDLCGNVYGTLMYNLSSSYPDTPINTSYGDKPFFVNEYPAYAIKACPNNPLSANDFCNLTWIVNASGEINTDWKFGVYFNSSYSEVQPNNTKNATVSIVACTVDFSLTWHFIDFGELIPNTYNNSAPGNSNNLYNITVNPGSCNLDLYIRGSDLTNSTFGSIIKVGNLSWSNISNNINDGYFQLTETNSVIKLNVPENTNITTWYWLNVPPIYAGFYTGTIYITGVKHE
ncbi:MAG: hypothetical protein QW423_03285 [Candidatus Aenigmatarchaeota archaeon]